MSSDLRTVAESRLTGAAADRALADPRPPLRERLRRLRETHPAAFTRAVEHYEQQVLPALAGEDPLTAWLDYGRFVGELTANGRLAEVDPSGLAQTLRTPVGSAALVLFVPEDTAEEVLVLLAPVAPAPAQQATLDLLVHRRLQLTD